MEHILPHSKTRPGPAHAFRGLRAGAARRLVPVLLGCCFCLTGIVPPLGAQTLKVWNSTVPLPAEPGEVVDAALSRQSMLVVRRDGTVTGSGTIRIGISWVPVSTITAGLSGVVAVAAGAGHSLALKSDGTVTAWGIDNDGQATVPPGLTGVVAIAAGEMHSLALKDDGTVAAWGYECTVPAGLSGVVAIAAEGHYSLALKSDGTLVSWGQTYNRQMNPAGVTAATAGAMHSLALKTDGTVTAWGGELYGECRVPAGLTGVVELAAGTYYSLALKSDRTLAVWGNAGEIPAAGVPEVAAVSASIYGTVALLDTPGRPPAILGSMRALATGGYGSFRHRIATASPAVSFAAAGLPPGLVLDTATGIITGTAAQPGRHSVLLSATNAHGTDQRELILTVTGKPAWVEGGMPENWTVGLPTSARVLASGDALFSATGLPPGTGIDAATGAITGAPSLPGLYSVTFSLTNPLGTTVKTMEIGVSNIHLWGPGDISLIYPPDVKNTTGHVPAGISCAVAVASGRGHTVALSCDGAVFSWGRPGYQLQVPSSLDGVRVKAIAAGPYHSLAVKEDGTVTAWGLNMRGECDVPAGLTGAVAAAAGWDYSLVLKSDGTVTGWPSGSPAYNPGEVPAGLSGVKAIAGGGQHAVALRQDGTVVVWGNNSWGQTNMPAGLADVTAIAAGSRVSMALRRDGTVVAWGDNLTKQLDVPPGLADVTAIAMGEYHCLALRRDGTVVIWGGGHFSVSSPPGINRGVAAIAGGTDFSVLLLGPGMTSPSTASVRVSAPFSHTVTSWPGAAISIANPPAGLAFAPATGVLSGSVGQAGRYDMEVTLGYPGYLSAKSVLTLYVLDSGFAAWRARCFTGAGTALTGPADDPDGDGMANMVEYGRGTEPLTADAENYAVPSAAGGGGGTAVGPLEITLEVLAPMAAELNVQARFGGMPAATLPEAVPTPALSQALDNGYHRFVFRDADTGPAPRRFGQLVMSLKP